MELTPKQQALELINKSKRILLVTHEKPDGDALGSITSLYLVLSKLGKVATAVVLDQVGPNYRFIPKTEDFTKGLAVLRDFVISVDCSAATADKLAYNFQDGKLNIVITPKSGNFRPQDVSFAEGSFQFDLVIVLDSADWDQVGRPYADNAKLFQTVPVINIDHHSSNDYFGTVNLVDLTAASTTEILVGVIEALGNSLIDEDVATSLLTGIISDTGSFQHSNTTPKALTVAAQMVGFGARQQEIIRNLFKTKAYTTLKLWGKVLSQLQYDVAHRLSWTLVPFSFFAETGASVDETSGLIDELMTSVPGADVVVLISEKEPKVLSGSIRTKKGVDAAEIAGLFGGGGHPGAAGFKLVDLGIDQAEGIIVNKIREYQAKSGVGTGLGESPELIAPTAPPVLPEPVSSSPTPPDEPSGEPAEPSPEAPPALEEESAMGEEKLAKNY